MSKKLPTAPWCYKKVVETKYDSKTGAPQTWTYHWILNANGSKIANSLDCNLIDAPADDDSPVARLISAAPEMLEFLQRLEKEADGDENPLAKELRALIAKATGGEA